MKKDIIEGALLPSITLAVKPERVPDLRPLHASSSFDQLALRLSQPGQVNILDGLQRTYIIKDLVDEGVELNPLQTLHLEFWLEDDINNLVYRIIVLNAGQKPMSMRHQIELLFSTLKQKLEDEIKDLEIYRERDQTRRRSPRKFALDRLAAAYQSYITRSPEVSRENIVAQQIVEANAMDASEEELTSEFNSFVQLLKRYCRLDDEVCRVYPERDDSSEMPTGANWFGSDNVLQAFFSAYSQYVSGEIQKQRAEAALDKILQCLRRSSPEDDPLGLHRLLEIQKGLSPRKVNIGTGTRRLLSNGFKELFRGEGDISMEDCWTLAAE
ncbi:hypothetical protein [Cyanobium gracile]|uniref:Uncharacterized protein n=1 Tax=Cyanobium gracile (strain ATCC 27147 / PCC 6307) TaxID=292564 RepID=K9P653_CYAGP|nr:hypothetical protein [Cyanobium gracile]AFY28443.1 hypothetical protein Cyagr_1267 [Cyanobium gracile PCC 6307]